MKIKLTKKQANCIGPFLERYHIARTAFRDASEMQYKANADLWKHISAIHPDVIRIECPSCDYWYFILSDRGAKNENQDD